MAMLLDTMVQGDWCTENAARDKDPEGQTDYITNPGTTQQTDVSNYRRNSVQYNKVTRSVY